MYDLFHPVHLEPALPQSRGNWSVSVITLVETRRLACGEIDHQATITPYLNAPLPIFSQGLWPISLLLLLQRLFWHRRLLLHTYFLLHIYPARLIWHLIPHKFRMREALICTDQCSRWAQMTSPLSEHSLCPLPPVDQKPVSKPLLLGHTLYLQLQTINRASSTALLQWIHPSLESTFE